MAATPKSVLYVALMGTILSVLIAICCKRLFTAGAYILIIGFAINLIEVLIPPLISATVRTESLCLSPGCLHNRDSTVKAEMPGFINRSRCCDHSAKSVSPTVGFYGIAAKSKCLRYLSVA